MFRHGLAQGEALSLDSLRNLLPEEMPGGVDSPSWRLTTSGSFSVRTAYRALFRGPLLPWTAPLVKAPIPLKTKIFVWQLLRDWLPSRVEVAKRNGPGNGLFPLCVVPETMTHIMFSCPAAQFLWRFLHEALGPEWQASDLSDFIEVHANNTGRRRRLFWLLFTALS
jgi:hypothetical protein